MIVAAEKRRARFGPGATIIEATSGNTGISLAMIAAVRGYRCVLVMPEDMSLERRYVLRAYGAEIDLTPAGEGMAGAVERARELADEHAQRLHAAASSRTPRTPSSHERTTALEILEQTGGKLDAFVAGRRHRRHHHRRGPRAAREARRRDAHRRGRARGERGALGAAPAGMHGIQGLGAGLRPADTRPHRHFDEIVTVTDVAAERMARRLAREAGLLVGPQLGRQRARRGRGRAGSSPAARSSPCCATPGSDTSSEPALPARRRDGVPGHREVLRGVPQHPAARASLVGVSDLLEDVLRSERRRVVGHALDPGAHAGRDVRLILADEREEPAHTDARRALGARRARRTP